MDISNLQNDLPLYLRCRSQASMNNPICTAADLGKSSDTTNFHISSKELLPDSSMREQMCIIEPNIEHVFQPPQFQFDKIDAGAPDLDALNSDAFDFDSPTLDALFNTPLPLSLDLLSFVNQRGNFYNLAEVTSSIPLQLPTTPHAEPEKSTSVQHYDC
ncbi:hypothetical protein P280DRAFT_522975 [Massarina eburnea CBS 473.64]|uniref:Uncharacterized protein n=1 Tax=Massarina eburnea CBS 473.64 TaxID=1395130 RepID=A0A6A6RM89_9PLEO|nr:hypothetical protein P280DRAFT_522975 [Massarina eburnea CBS 473.64]